jgi:integrase
MAEISNGVFEFAKRFPDSKKKAHLSEKEGKGLTIPPEDLTFGVYYEHWWKRMKPGMTENQIRDYTTILNFHLLPYFKEMPFKEITPFEVKTFIAHLKGKKTRYGDPLSGKRIRNIMIPFRMIVRDALDEYAWDNIRDPFANLKLPKVRKYHVQPFNLVAWQMLMAHIPDFYKPYFEFAVQTGLRPSEQVALKWARIDSDFMYIESSRVLGREKADLKTEESKKGDKIEGFHARGFEKSVGGVIPFSKPLCVCKQLWRPHKSGYPA